MRATCTVSERANRRPTYKFEKPEDIKYTHVGSIGNLCNDEIKKTMQKVISAFDFKKVEKALAELLNS